MGVYAWCPECGALRHLTFGPNGGTFDWPRWVVPGDIDHAHKLMAVNRKAEAG